MNTIEQSEREAANAVLDYAIQLVKYYVDDPGDIDAAMIAVLVTAIELVADRKIHIERIYGKRKTFLS